MKPLLPLCTCGLLMLALAASGPVLGAEAPEKDPKAAAENGDDKTADKAKDSDEDKAKPAAAATPSTHVVKKGPLKIEISLVFFTGYLNAVYPVDRIFNGFFFLAES